MARYNTVLPATTTTTTATVAAPGAGLLTKFTGTAPYTVTISSPVVYAGASQTFYNATSGTITISTPAGTFAGPGSSGSSSQTITTGTTLQIYSDGTNWVTLGAGGGPLIATTGTFSGGVSGITTLSASGALSLTSTSDSHTVASTTDSTTAATGALQVAGGLAVNKNITLGKAGNTGVVLKFLGSTSGSITFQAPATAGAQTYTFPSADAASSGYALVSNGAGTLSWAAAGATITASTSGSTFYPVFASSTSGSLTVANVATSGFNFVPSTGTLTVTSLTESSSITLKENVNPINNALDSILQLVGVTYDRRDGSSKGEAGLIAEEVNKVIPHLVTKDSDGNPTGIHYTKLTAYLIESVKALKDEIDQLKGSKKTKGKK